MERSESVEIIAEVESMLSEIRKAIVMVTNFGGGISKRDIYRVLLCPRLFEGVITLFQEIMEAENMYDIDIIAGVEPYGFLLGTRLAAKLNLPFVRIEMGGNLPGKVITEKYRVGSVYPRFQVQADAIKENQNVVLVNDYLSNGDIVAAAVNLITKATHGVAPLCLVVVEEKHFGWKKIVKAPVYSLLKY